MKSLKKKYTQSNSKYRAVKTTINGIKFDSKLEASYYQYLMTRSDIEILEIQPKIYLSKAKVLYKPDFKIRVLSTNEVVYIDVKGFETPVFKIKKRLWKAYRYWRLLVVKKNELDLN